MMYPYGAYPFYPYQIIEEKTDLTYCERHKDLCPQSCPFRKPLKRRIRAPITAPAGAGLWGSGSGNFGSLGTDPPTRTRPGTKAAIGLGAAALLWLVLSSR